MAIKHYAPWPSSIVNPSLAINNYETFKATINNYQPSAIMSHHDQLSASVKQYCRITSINHEPSTANLSASFNS